MRREREGEEREEGEGEGEGEGYSDLWMGHTYHINAFRTTSLNPGYEQNQDE